MSFCISAQFKRTLSRSAAIFILCGAVVGCSRGIDGLTDGFVTNSTSRSASQNIQPRPSVAVGEGYGVAAAPVYQQPAYQQPVYQQQVATYPAAPSYSQNVTSSPLPPPQYPSGSVQTASLSNDYGYGNMASRPVSNQPVSSMPVAAQPAAPQYQPPVAQKPTPAQAGSYVVASGDTLYGIARNTGVSASAIQKANGLSSIDSIRIGQRLVIPGGQGSIPGSAIAAAPVKPTATPSSPSQKQNQVVRAPEVTAPATTTQKPKTVASYTPPVAEKPVAASNNGANTVASKSAESSATPPNATGVEKLRWPVRGRVISQFGASSGGRTSDGIDISVPEGASVRAAENGVVIYAGDGLKGFGNTVLLRHENGLVTVYGHASQLKVKRGDEIKRGQEIALAGMTGDADNPKLHFEVRKGTNPVNPITYLE